MAAGAALYNSLAHITFETDAIFKYLHSTKQIILKQIIESTLKNNQGTQILSNEILDTMTNNIKKEINTLDTNKAINNNDPETIKRYNIQMKKQHPLIKFNNLPPFFNTPTPTTQQPPIITPTNQTTIDLTETTTTENNETNNNQDESITTPILNNIDQINNENNNNLNNTDAIEALNGNQPITPPTVSMNTQLQNCTITPPRQLTTDKDSHTGKNLQIIQNTTNITTTNNTTPIQPQQENNTSITAHPIENQYSTPTITQQQTIKTNIAEDGSDNEDLVALSKQFETTRTLNSVRFKMGPIIDKERGEIKEQDPTKIDPQVQNIIEKQEFYYITL